MSTRTHTQKKKDKKEKGKGLDTPFPLYISISLRFQKKAFGRKTKIYISIEVLSLFSTLHNVPDSHFCQEMTGF